MPLKDRKNIAIESRRLSPAPFLLIRTRAQVRQTGEYKGYAQYPV